MVKAATAFGPAKRPEDSAHSASRSTRAEFDLADPIATAADTEYQHRLMLVLGELEAGRSRFAAPTDKRELAGMVTLAGEWATRLSDVLTAAVPPDASDAAVTSALAAAGQFVSAARELGERPGGWKTVFGLFGGGPVGSTSERVRLLTGAPDVLELLLSAMAVGFQLPDLAAGWVTTAATFADELRRELFWTLPVAG